MSDGEPDIGVAQQLTLDFPHRPALGAEDFFVSSSNRAAVELIDNWPNWPNLVMYLEGSNSSGKSHLAHVWQVASKAVIVSADSLSRAQLQLLNIGQPLVIEDMDRGIIDEHALFHLINLSKEHEFHLLFTGAVAPGRLEIELPDLRSRMRAMAVVQIDAPDEMLLRTMLIKQFEDRQLDVSPNLIEYILPRMERSFSGLMQLTTQLDQLSLSTGRKITRQFAGEVLRSFESSHQS